MARLPLASVTPRPGPRGRLLPTVLGLALAAGLAAPALSQTPSFTLLANPSRVRGVSTDGRTAAGVGALSIGFVWHADTGRYDFGNEPGIRGSEVYGLSGDGSTVVGYSDSGTHQRGFTWAGPGTFQLLGTVGSYTESVARGVSGDGAIVVGESFDPTGEFGQAFRWTSGGGMQGLGYLVAGSSFSTARAVSRDGSTIVGWSTFPGGGHTDAFRWTSSGGMQPLPSVPGAIGTHALAVNPDGGIISGYADNGHAVLWLNGQSLDLGTLPSSTGTAATSVSDDGSVVAGFSYTFPQQAVAWTPTTGMVPLADYLTANGVTIPAGWTLSDCMAISADGTTFAGLASNGALRQGYIVSVPSPSPLVLGMSSLLVAFRRPSRKAACP